MGLHPFAAIAVYVAAVSLFFLVFPGVDLAASGVFFRPGDGFWAQDVPFLRQFRGLGPYLVRLIAIACVVILLLKLLLPARQPLVPLRKPLFLLTTLILGPGVLVNLILKNNWGRPRPVMVDLFGGDMPYQLVWVPSNWCSTNCSFVSGEGSAAMWLLAGLILVAPKAWRWGVLAVFAPIGFLLSLNRVAFGGHFTSDTLLSWGLTLAVVLLVHRVFFRWTPAWATDAALDERLTRWGRSLHGAGGRIANRMGRMGRRFLGMFRD
ncbi:phosphatase PAP2 family protein [Roseibium suaedae]|uniref:Membrane-associated enzyme, PAP2 (Acid phosphatase) superfamily n=1 Tax=Roseibium suaedae TaxID=735517 RepID=A0A1M7N1M5_9HYPH|nr:phosphatase PAP2 family protein [Roseibium suaedae]SHM97310.1 Membrane-associated enzyme, PAP2 (acid phosphatase) superfamily [Roseibium suaedae]